MEPSKSRNRHWPEIERALRRRGLYKPNTLKSYEAAAKYLADFDPKTMTQDSVDLVRDRIHARHQRGGRRARLMGVKMILRRVYKRDDLELTVPRNKPGVKDVIETDEFQRIIDAADRQRDDLLKAALLTQYEAVLRPSEVAAVDVDDFSLDAKELRIRDGKTDDRVVNLSDRAVAAVRAWLGRRGDFAQPGDRAAFVSRRTRRRITKAYLTKNLKKLAAQAGVQSRVYPQLVRASGITHLLNAGVNPAVVQAQAGHANIATTWVYNRPTMRDQRRLLDAAWTRLSDDVRVKTPAEVAQDLIVAYQRSQIGLTELKTLLAGVGRVESQSSTGKADAGYA